MAVGAWHLERKQERLKREILDHLDFLNGSVTSQGPSGGFNLTSKEDGKTRSRYIRIGMLEEVRRRTLRRRRLKALLDELAELNWRLLQMKNSG